MSKLLVFSHVFAKPGATDIVDAVDPDTSRGLYSGKTIDQLRLSDPTIEVYPFDDWEAKRNEAMNTPIEWQETTEDEYDEMLGAVPPNAMSRLGFLLGEPQDHFGQNGAERCRAYIVRDGKYLKSNRPITRAEFRALK